MNMKRELNARRKNEVEIKMPALQPRTNLCIKIINGYLFKLPKEVQASGKYGPHIETPDKTQSDQTIRMPIRTEHEMSIF